MSTVTSIADDLVFDVLVVLPAKSLVQIPACLGRANYVVPSLDDDDRQVLDLVRILDQLTVLHESTIDKVVRLDPRESESPTPVRDETPFDVEGY